jgi:curved DNA-binding protein CbpA
MKNYYKILQLPLLSSIDEVRRSYKILALKYHPDKNNNQRFYVDYFTEINEAYKFLSSDIDKCNYDVFIRQNPDFFKDSSMVVFDNSKHDTNKQNQFSQENPNNPSNSRNWMPNLIYIVLAVFCIFVFAYFVFFTTNQKVENLDAGKNTVVHDFQNARRDFNYADSLNNLNKVEQHIPENLVEIESSQTTKQVAHSDCGKISVFVQDGSLTLINKNNNAVFRVNVKLSKKKISYIGGERFEGIDFVDKAWFNIGPGPTTVIFSDPNLEGAWVESCE